MITLAPTSFTAEKIALAVPGTPAIPVLQQKEKHVGILSLGDWYRL